MQDLITRQLGHTIATLNAVRSNEPLLHALTEAAQAVASSMQQGGKLLVAGNGGSAADAQHLVAEFVSRLMQNRAAMPALALTTDTSILTAIGNDFSYDNVFERQVEALGKSGDVFLGISTSGNAKNLVKALEMARGKGLTTVGFLGNNGGTMAPLCDHAVIVPSNVTMHIQECHLALEHIFCMLVERFYFGPEFDNTPQYLAE